MFLPPSILPCSPILPYCSEPLLFDDYVSKIKSGINISCKVIWVEKEKRC